MLAHTKMFHFVDLLLWVLWISRNAAVQCCIVMLCCILVYRVFLSSLVKQEVDMLPRGLKSAFSLRQQSSASSYHSLPVTSVLRAVVDDLRSVGKQGRHVFDSVVLRV